MTPFQLAELKKKIWSSQSLRPVDIYGVFDCARRPEIHDIVRRSYRQKSCLFAGNLNPVLEKAAPYLVELHPKDLLTDKLLLNGWEDAWGILIQSEHSFAELRRHLRTFLRVRDEAGRILFFRYYDPRVLSIYLPTCTAKELGQIFGSAILSIFMPAQDLCSSLSYRLVDGALHWQELQ